MIKIPLLQPQDGFVGSDFVRFDPVRPEDGGLVFVWGQPENSAPGQSFTLQVSTGANFANIVASKTVTDLYTAALDIDLLPQTIYYWRVMLGGEVSSFSTFYTTLAAPILTEAINDIGIAGTSVKVSWNTLNPAVSNVRLRYGTAPGTYDNTIVFPAQPTSGIISGLQTGVNYYFVGVAEGGVEFDYATTLASAGLNLVVTSDNSQVIIEDHNYVVVNL